MNPGRYTINVNSGRYIYTGSDPAPKIGTEVECTRRAIIWLQHLQEQYQQPAIDIDNPPQWVDEILTMPWMEEQIPMAKRYIELIGILQGILDMSISITIRSLYRLHTYH